MNKKIFKDISFSVKNVSNLLNIFIKNLHRETPINFV